MSRVQIVMFVSAAALLLAVLNLVRSRKLREEYSWLWLLASFGFLLLTTSSVIYGWVVWLIGASNAALTFAFLGLYFLVLICIQFSVQLSQLQTKSKNLAQEIAIHDGEIRKLQQAAEAANPIRAGQSQGNGHQPAEVGVPRSAVPAGNRAKSEVKLSNNAATEDPLPGLMPPPTSPGHHDHAKRHLD